MEPVTVTAPVVVDVEVDAPVERAFHVFTEGMGSWWPVSTHSIEGDDVMSAAMECRLGGRVVERHRDGTEANWGVITSWDPPHRVAFSWNPSYEKRPETHVVVRFEIVDDRRTRVTLEHSGWERLGTEGLEMRAGYDEGWRHILFENYAPRVA